MATYQVNEGSVHPKRAHTSRHKYNADGDTLQARNVEKWWLVILALVFLLDLPLLTFQVQYSPPLRMVEAGWPVEHACTAVLTHQARDGRITYLGWRWWTPHRSPPAGPGANLSPSWHSSAAGTWQRYPFHYQIPRISLQALSFFWSTDRPSRWMCLSSGQHRYLQNADYKISCLHSILSHPAPPHSWAPPGETVQQRKQRDNPGRWPGHPVQLLGGWTCAGRRRLWWGKLTGRLRGTRSQENLKLCRMITIQLL